MRAQYLCELTLQEYGFLKFLPSMIAASALFLALHSLEQGQWVRARAMPRRTRQAHFPSVRHAS